MSNIQLQPSFMVAIQDRDHGPWCLIGPSMPTEQVAAASVLNMLDVYDSNTRLVPVRVDARGVHLLCDPTRGLKAPVSVQA